MFAELVKDKRTRELALKEILDNKDSNGGDAVEVVDVDNGHSSRLKTNGIRNDVIDITDGGSQEHITLVDTMSNDSTDTRSSNVPQKIPVLVPGLPPVPMQVMTHQPKPPLPPHQHHHQSISTIITTTHVSPATVIMNNNIMIQTQHQQFMNRAALMAATAVPPPPPHHLHPQQHLSTGVVSSEQKKPKSLTTLPLPPGTNVQELVNAKTPSPPYSPRTDKQKASHSRSSKEATTSKNKKSLLNLPMPQMGTGLPADDGSGDEDSYDGKGGKGAGTNGGRLLTPSKKKTIKRPIILNRRNSRSTIGPGPGGLDWGERSVDVFEVVVQIGEGTYGQVSNQYFTYDNNFDYDNNNVNLNNTFRYTKQRINTLVN